MDAPTELNPGKTQAILIGSKHNLIKVKKLNSPKIRVNGTIIEFTTTAKYLGFTFNETFSSSNHVDEIIKKANFSLSKVNHCKRSIPPDAKLRIVNEVMLLLFDYASIIYHGYDIRVQRGMREVFRSRITNVFDLSPRLMDLKGPRQFSMKEIC